MKCPMCNKEMRVLIKSDVIHASDGNDYMNVVGCCYDCDFDATWDIITNTTTKQINEINLQQYYFG